MKYAIVEGIKSEATPKAAIAARKWSLDVDVTKPGFPPSRE